MTGDTVTGPHVAIVKTVIMAIPSHGRCSGIAVQTGGRVVGCIGCIGVTLDAAGAVSRDGDIPVRRAGGMATGSKASA